MRRHINHIKRLERLHLNKQLPTDIGHEADLIRLYLNDEITADEHQRRSLVKVREQTPAMKKYSNYIMNKYLKGEWLNE